MGNSQDTSKATQEQNTESEGSWGSAISSAFESVDISGGIESGVEFFSNLAKEIEGYISTDSSASHYGSPVPWGGMLPHPVASKKLYRFGNENFRVGLATMHGWRPTMEDAHSIVLSLPKHPDISFFSIFDGHGGSRASAYVAERLAKKIDELEDVFDQKSLIQICLDLDQELLDSFDKNEANVGSTCIFTLIKKVGENYRALFCNIGDSRTVLGKKKSNGFKAVAVTEDHNPNLPEELTRIEKAGGRVFISRVDGMLAVSRAFGDVWFKTPESFSARDRKVSAVPEFQCFDISPNDIILMACDGIYEGEIFTRESVVEWIANKMETFQDVAVICGLLLNECLSRGSRDNMSCMLVTFKDGIEFAKNPMDFIPGPWFEMSHESDWGTLKFQQVYEDDAKASGYTREQAVKLRSQMERQRTMMLNKNQAQQSGQAQQPGQPGQQGQKAQKSQPGAQHQ